MAPPLPPFPPAPPFTPTRHGPTYALSFEDVAKVYPDGTAALAHFSLQVAPGELVSVVGPSGCGKTTMLRIAAGLDEATSGAASADRDRLGLVFQESALLPWRTVQRNTELLLELQGVARPEREQRAASAIRAVGLEGFEHHHPKRLSGGMKMRAALARWLAVDPTVFLFDEPFAAADEITRDRLGEELLRHFEQRGFSGLFVTHSVYEAVYLSSRVVVMSARPGRIVAEVEVPFSYPRPAALRFEPALAEVAGRVSAALRRASLGSGAPAGVTPVADPVPAGAPAGAPAAAPAGPGRP